MDCTTEHLFFTISGVGVISEFYVGTGEPMEKIYEPNRALGFVRLTMDSSTAVPDMTVHSRERLLEIWSTPKESCSVKQTVQPTIH